jgi:ferredoxin
MKRLDPEEIYGLMPGTDCQMCGMTCREFVDFLVSGDLRPEDCPVFQEEPYRIRLEKLKELLGPALEREETGLIIDREKCNGCGICVMVCEYNIANSSEVNLGRSPRPEDNVAIAIENGRIKLVDPKRCTRSIQVTDKCTKCKDWCPTKAIDLL